MSSAPQGRDHGEITRTNDVDPEAPETPEPGANPWSAAGWARGPRTAHGHWRHGRPYGTRRHRGEHRPLRRSRDDRLVAGVAGGLARRLCVDVTLVRVGLVLLALFSGFGAAAYVLAWLLVPADGESSTVAARALSDRRGMALALAAVPALVLLVVLASATGVGYLATFGWPLVLAGAGTVLAYRNEEPGEQARLRQALASFTEFGSPGRRSRRSLVVRIVLGLALLAAGAALVALGHAARGAFNPLVGSLLVLGAFVVLFGPWWLRLARDLVTERSARIRAEERADMAAQVHDSVLQTLALIQRNSAEPHKVAQLARAQERELRAWLFDGVAPGSPDGAEPATVAVGVALIERDVEAAHGVAVDAVSVGDCPLDDDLKALLAAAREATVNAAKWSGAPTVSVYAEVEPGAVSVFVRDRGSGFDPAAVGPDRRGLAESVVGRMTRHGGTAAVRSVPGRGTEVELRVPRRPARP